MKIDQKKTIVRHRTATLALKDFELFKQENLMS